MDININADLNKLFEQAVDSMAKAMSTTTEHLLPIFKKQALVDSITNSSILIMPSF